MSRSLELLTGISDSRGRVLVNGGIFHVKWDLRHVFSGYEDNCWKASSSSLRVSIVFMLTLVNDDRVFSSSI